MFGVKNKDKVRFVVVMKFTRRPTAEIAKNILDDEHELTKKLLKEKSKFTKNDFIFGNFSNKDKELFTIIFQVMLKNKESHIDKLKQELNNLFDSNDIYVVPREAFDFAEYGIKNPTIKGDINLSDNSKKHQNDASIAKATNQQYIDNTFNGNNSNHNTAIESESNTHKNTNSKNGPSFGY